MQNGDLYLFKTELPMWFMHDDQKGTFPSSFVF